MATGKAPARNRASTSLGAEILAALIGGKTLSAIARAEGFGLRKVENLMRRELRKNWIAPLHVYVPLQIMRLESIAEPLKKLAVEGDLNALDRLLKVYDRLDRYYGLVKFAARGASVREDARPALIALMNQAADDQT